MRRWADFSLSDSVLPSQGIQLGPLGNMTYCPLFSSIPVLFYPILSYPVISCPILSCPSTPRFPSLLPARAYRPPALPGHGTALHGTALHRTALHSTALHYAALYCTAQHCTALHCIVLHCTELHCTTLHCTALHCTPIEYCKVHQLVGPGAAVQCTCTLYSLQCTVFISLMYTLHSTLYSLQYRLLTVYSKLKS